MSIHARLIVAAVLGFALLNPRAANAQATEGVVVHGDWVIEVREEDGSLAERRSFKNGLSSNGAQLLGGPLSRTKTPGSWSILLYTPLPDAFDWARSIAIYEPIEPVRCNNPAFPKSDWLACTVTIDDSDPRRLVLKAVATAPVTTTIDHVVTRNRMCNGNISSMQCAIQPDADSISEGFTETPVKNNAGIPTPLPLEKGQIVQVTVTISFSSPGPPHH